MNNKNYGIRSIGILMGVMGFVSKLIYRPFIMTNNINDIGINEFAPSFFYTAGICLIGAGYSTKTQKKTMIFLALGSLAYEIEQIFSARVFDFKDIAAIVIAFFISIVILKIYESKEKQLTKKNCAFIPD
jgi:hypothetical protein